MPTNPKLDQINVASATAMAATVSPGLHPDALIPFAEPLLGHEGALAAYQSGRAAQKALYEALRDMSAAEHETRQKFGGHLVVDGKTIQRAIPEERQAELAANLGNRFESTARNFDRHLGVVNETIEALTSRIERALAPKKDTPATAQAASDIRNYVRGLDDHKRLDFLHQAAKSDHEVITAVLSTTPWVSGLNREQAAMIKDMASEHFAANEYKARGAAVKVADHLRSSSQNFVAAYKKLQPVIKPSAHTAAIAKLKEAV